ncbi:MAG: hypothetical protein HY507_01035 [Candidatus Zambryskibacteria bacterium]|nr:hypothetical protein [Candidatus Zambryskibacteria bacterium]
MSEIQSWGVSYNPAMTHAMDYECKCGWSWIQAAMAHSQGNRYEQIVGFDTNQPFQTARAAYSIGIVIIECPRCFRKFWFHIELEKADTYRDLCIHWPK